MASLLKKAKLEIGGKADNNCIMIFNIHEKRATPKNHFTQLLTKILDILELKNNIFTKINPAKIWSTAPTNPTRLIKCEKPNPNAESAKVSIVPYTNNLKINLPFLTSTWIPICSICLINKAKTARVNQPLY